MNIGFEVLEQQKRPPQTPSAAPKGSRRHKRQSSPYRLLCLYRYYIISFRSCLLIGQEYATDQPRQPQRILTKVPEEYTMIQPQHIFLLFACLEK